MKKFSVFLIFLLIIGCNKNHEVPNNPSNISYSFNCPLSPLKCPFRDMQFEFNNDWVWINSGYSPLNEDSRITIDNKARTIEFHINSKNVLKYFYSSDPNNCSNLTLKEFNSGKDIRNLESLANDSILIIKDSINCPSQGCYCINKKYYKSFSLNYLKRLSCPDVNLTNLCCRCNDDQSGVDCSSKFKSIDMFLSDEPLSTLKLTNGNIIILLAGNQNPGPRLAVCCFDQNAKIIWQLDLSNAYTKNYFYQLDEQSNIIESTNGNINILLSENISTGGFYNNNLNIHTISPSGSLINTRSQLLSTGTEFYAVNKIHTLNNQEYCIEFKGFKYAIALLDKDLNLISFNNSITTPQNYNDLVVSSFSDQNYFYKMYTQSASIEKYLIYKYSKQGNLLNTFEINPKVDGKLVDGKYSRIVKVQDKLVQYGNLFDTKSNSHRSFWVIYDLNFNQISSNFSNSGSLSEMTCLFNFPNSTTLRIIDGSEKEVYISDYNITSNKLINGLWLRKNVYGDYAPRYLINSYIFQEKQIIIGDGWYFGSNLLFYSFNKDKFYEYEICK